MSIKNASTSVDYWKTLGELHMLLAKGGAAHINVRHENGLPVGMSFSIEIDGFPVNFMLPCHIEGLKDILAETKAGRRLNGANDAHDKALRVGWRIVKDWVDAQLAFIAARKAEDRPRALVTVFLPYAVNAEGTTLAEKLLKGNNFKQLTQ
jgi:hypothetical protein